MFLLQPTLRHLAVSTLRHLIEKDPVCFFFLFTLPNFFSFSHFWLLVCIPLETYFEDHVFLLGSHHWRADRRELISYVGWRNWFRVSYGWISSCCRNFEGQLFCGFVLSGILVWCFVMIHLLIEQAGYIYKGWAEKRLKSKKIIWLKKNSASLCILFTEYLAVLFMLLCDCWIGVFFLIYFNI